MESESPSSDSPNSEKNLIGCCGDSVHDKTLVEVSQEQGNILDVSPLTDMGNSCFDLPDENLDFQDSEKIDDSQKLEDTQFTKAASKLSLIDMKDDGITNISVDHFRKHSWNRDYSGELEKCSVGAGLYNLGNTCFLNAVMQCFTHTVVLVQGVMSLKHEASSHGVGEFCVLCAVRDQIEHAILNSGRVISPSYLVDNLSNISSSFQRFEQEDAHEFLQCLLDKLDSNWLKYEAGAIDASTSDNSSFSDHTLVKQIFGGRLVSQVHCCKCGHNSDTLEPLIDLSLEIEDVDSLESALESFTKVECLETYTCASCKEQVQAEKQLLLDQAPSVAALHLKRFKSDGAYVEKIDKMVEYPLELDLAPYTKGSNDGNEYKYELFAVVVHVGYSSNSGHYFSYIRSSPDEWYRFDDSKVSRVDGEQALREDAYILLYAMKGTPWFSSMIEQWKEVSREKILNTSPTSVLYTDVPSTSYPIRTRHCGFEPRINFNALCDTSTAPAPESGPKQGGDTCIGAATELIENSDVTKADDGTWDFSVANQIPASFLSVSTDNMVKEDKAELEYPSMEDYGCSTTVGDPEQTRVGTCTPSQVPNNFDIENKNDVSTITPSTPVRSTSPDIYSDEEPAEAAYDIPVNHLKMKPKLSSAKSVKNSKQDHKRKEAIKYLSKSAYGVGRRHCLMSAIHTQSSSCKKKRKQASLYNSKPSPKKRVKISPKHVQQPLTV
ncbi:unnamed protein product [Amaranthus hypochondriacus]